MQKPIHYNPIANAAVVFHSVKDDKDEGNLEVKTNEEGKAIIDIIDKYGCDALRFTLANMSTPGRDIKLVKAKGFPLDTIVIDHAESVPTKTNSVPHSWG